jgi:hypothetical protein
MAALQLKCGAGYKFADFGSLLVVQSRRSSTIRAPRHNRIRFSVKERRNVSSVTPQGKAPPECRRLRGCGDPSLDG